MRAAFESVISRGGYDLDRLLRRIDEYHVEGKLSDDDRAELITLARGQAVPGVDASAEVQLLWAALRELTGRVAVLEGNVTEEGGADIGNAAEYKQPTGAHDAYYTDDIVTYRGKVYTCITPAGVACVWSPDALPEYWEALT